MDETYWDGEEKGLIGWMIEDKTLDIVAAEQGGKGIGRIRLRRIRHLTKASMHSFIAEAIEPCSTVCTDGLNLYCRLVGYDHDQQVQRRQPEGEYLMPRVHQVVSLLKLLLLGMHQQAIGQ